MAQRATKVVFLTEGARLSFGKRTGVAANGMTIYPGADPDKISSIPWRKGNICRFAHIGTLAGSRNLRTFLQALAALFKESPAWLGQVEVHLYGHSDRAMRDLGREFPHPGVIKDHGRLPRKEVLSAMMQTDVLLLVQNAEPISGETIPSKLYEYLFAGRPILGLTHENTELTTLLHDRGHYAAEVGNVAEIHKSLARILEGWADGFAAWRPEPLPSVTIQTAVRQLVESLCENVVRPAPATPRAYAQR